MPTKIDVSSPRTPAAIGKGRSWREIALLAATALVVIFTLIPITYLAIRAFEKPLPEIFQLLFRDKTLEVVGRTTFLVLIVVAFNTIVGTILATGIFFVKLPFARYLIIPAILPLAIPSYVFTYTWLAIVPSLSGFFAASFILILTTMPYAVLATLIGLRRVDTGLIEVAQTLGLGRVQIFFRVIFPQIRLNISAGALLIGLYVMSDFGAVSLLNTETLTVSIQNMYKASYDRSAAAVIAMILILASAIFILLEERFKGSSKSSAIAKSYSVKTLLIEKISYRTTILALLTIYVALAVFAPFYVLISRFLGNPEPIEFSNLFSAALSTITVSGLGALIALLLSIPISIMNSKSEGAVARGAERIILISHALPGVVIGLALVSLGSKISALYQTTLLLAFAYSLLFLAKSVASTTASLKQVPTVLKDVAASLGKSSFKVATQVTLPLALPGIGLGALLVFLTAMKELPATLMLRPTGMETLATQIWSFASINRFNEAAPYALLLVLIAAVPTFLLSLPERLESQDRDTDQNRIRDLGESR
jgi:iron(III) transport system permease protein